MIKMKLPKPQNHYEVDLIDKAQAKRLRKQMEVQFRGWESAVKHSDI